MKVSTELNINAMLGQPVDFSCTATGLPVPEVVWLRNGKIIIPDNRVRVKVNGVKSKLAIRNVTVGDWGEYTCLASNKLGEDSKTFHLIDGMLFCERSVCAFMASFVAVQMEDVNCTLKVGSVISPVPMVNVLKKYNSVMVGMTVEMAVMNWDVVCT